MTYIVMGVMVTETGTRQWSFLGGYLNETYAPTAPVTAYASALLIPAL